MTPDEQAAIAYLQTSQAIRDRCRQLFERCLAGGLEHFTCDLSQLDRATAYVLETIQQRYPALDVPFHSRWRHFVVEGKSALIVLDEALDGLTPAAAVRSRLDLAIVSVLLDAGAGAEWQFCDPVTGQKLGRSEGLAIASLRAFEAGLFSSDPAFPYQVDAMGLQQLTEQALAQAFQVSAENPLLGLQGRLTLLHQLGETLAAQPNRFGEAPARPGHLLDYWQATVGDILEASDLLTTVLESFGSIWPGRTAIAGVNLGDVWPHPALPDKEPGANLIPLHKLSQWLTYSLVEPLAMAGMTVKNLDALTGLAEYRNGGLCVDLQLLQLKQPDVLNDSHSPSSPLVVEWRALTVVLLDLISDRLRQRLSKTAEDLPLMKVLEGGTWAAGRRIAKQRRPAGTPPIAIQSDGTVF